MKDKSKPLTQADIVSFEKISKELGAIEEKITERIDHIFGIIFKAFETTKPTRFTWYFRDAQEGELGTIELDGEEIHYVTEGVNGGNIDRIDNGIWDYSTGMPKDFLSMKDEKIIEYIHKEIKDAEKKKEKQKEAVARNKAKREAIKNAAISKLTPEEKKALGV